MTMQSNILVDRGCYAKLADFGLSLIVAGTSITATTGNGSHRWSAPELIQNSDGYRTRETDVYAFGCAALEVSLLLYLSGEEQ
jgi:serine/threonine protein kinase